MKKFIGSVLFFPFLTFITFSIFLLFVYFNFIHMEKKLLIKTAKDDIKENSFILKTLIEEYSVQKDKIKILREIKRFATKRYIDNILIIDNKKNIIYSLEKKHITLNLNFNNINKYTIILNNKKIISIIPINYLYNFKNNKITKGYIIIFENLDYLISNFVYITKKYFIIIFITFFFLIIISFILFYFFFVKKYLELLELIPSNNNITKYDLLFMNIDKLIKNQKNTLKNIIIMSKVIQNSNDAIVITDNDYKILFTNKSFEKLTKYKLKEIQHQNILNLFRLKNLKMFSEIIFKNKENKELDLLITLIPIHSNNKISNYAFIIKDITQIKAKRKEIEKLAFYDPLTNLGNRYLFNKKLEELIVLGKEKNISFAIFIIDLDNFKEINDSLGPDIGDELLKKVAKILKKNFSKDTVISRFGGDVFGVISPTLPTPEAALEKAQNLSKELKKPIKINNLDIIHITCSIGISLYPTDGNDAKELLKKAEVALHKAKEKGKNQIMLFEEKMYKEILEKIEIKKELIKGIKNKEFILYLQPKINMHTNKADSFEGLIRWLHPKKGLIPPFKFIPIAESSELIIPMTELIFNQANKILETLHNNNFKNISIAINISAKHFKQNLLLKQIQNHLKKEIMQNTCIEIEVTESAIMEDISIAQNQLNQLHKLGIKVALDDYGTGYSSLRYLKDLPIDTIKIDKSFIDNITQEEKNYAIVKSTIEMAKLLNMKTVAEGVETKEQVEILKKLKVDYIQGYYYAKPMPFEEALEFLKKFNS